MIEVLIASVLLAMAAGYIASSILNSKRMFKTSTYQYVAVNLAREVLEFGVSTSYYHDNGMEYRYVPGQGYRGIPGYYDGAGGGHRWSGWWNTMDLGDIKQRGLVPKGAPDSVVIQWDVVRDPLFYNNFVHRVNITWEEDGVKHSRDLATVPISLTNDQLHLELSQFTWKEK
ncbi:MAG: hypothetical protein HY059_22800 [Proteobacteria bacterium]|nr:hypothetical protein [Pseudomonadota bacterium]